MDGKTKYIPVVDGEPNATRKGLRLIIDGVTVNDKGAICELYYRYSQWRESGGGIFELSCKNRHILGSEQRG